MKRDRIFPHILKSKSVRVIAAIFLLINIIWLINWWPYHQDISGYTKAIYGYYRDVEDYTCTVFPPSYLRFVGNYSVSNEDKMTLIIWPRTILRRNTEYGVKMLADDGFIYEFYIDRNLEYVQCVEMKYLHEEEEYIRKQLRERGGDLRRMFSIAEQEWGAGIQ